MSMMYVSNLKDPVNKVIKISLSHEKTYCSERNIRLGLNSFKKWSRLYTFLARPSIFTSLTLVVVFLVTLGLATWLRESTSKHGPDSVQDWTILLTTT